MGFFFDFVYIVLTLLLFLMGEGQWPSCVE